MGRLYVMAAECKYKNRGLKENFINGLNDNNMTRYNNLTAKNGMMSVMNKQVLVWQRRGTESKLIFYRPSKKTKNSMQ